ncbi:MAG: CRISPR-associated DxTHG motif protein, partial [Pyrinomonadaceae bacterium]
KLKQWEAVLNKYLNDTKMICKIVGDATKSDSPTKIVESILPTMNDGDRVVFDVTHGLRNQPIITSFVIMYLRYLKNIKEVEFYYGAKDLDGKVVRLDFCNDLLRATEAVAIYEQTGNYEQIGRNLGMSDSFDRKLEKLVFLDEVNKTDPQIPKELAQELENSTFEPLQKSLVERFKQPIYWAKNQSLSKQLQHKALFAFDRKQYYKAVLILTEAIVVAYGENCGDAEIAENLATFSARNRAEDELIGKWNDSSKVYVVGVLDEAQKQTYLNLKKLRNAMAHGTDVNGKEEEAKATRKAVDDEEKLRTIFNEGAKLFAAVSNQMVGR